MLNHTESQRVLIVDDEKVIADSLALILQKSGFDAKAVYSGEKAIEAAQDMKPDVMISDVVMSGITGIEAALQITKKWPDCRVILFSGQATTADLLRHATSEGHVFEILSKPLHPQVLIDQLANRPAFNAGTTLAC